MSIFKLCFVYFLIMNSASPAPKAIEYEGHNAGTRIPCYLTVNRIFSLANILPQYNPQAEIYIEIQDPNFHGMNRGFQFDFTINPSLVKSGFYEGSNQNIEQIVVAVDAKRKLQQITKYVMKWRHIDHYHQTVCIGLDKFFNQEEFSNQLAH